MGVFEFILLLVLITTGGKILSERIPRGRQEGPPPLPPGDVERMREILDDLGSRVERLEEERDFYRDLLESPERPRGIPGPDAGTQGGGSGQAP